MEKNLQVNSDTSLIVQKQSRPLLAVLNEDYPKIRTVANCDVLIAYLIEIFNLKISSSEEKKDFDLQMLVILDFIRSEFGFLTTEEVKQAFKMYVAKKFGHKDIFRLLDVIVVSDVLNCFVEFRSDSLRTYTQKAQNLMIESQNKMSDSEKFDIMTNAINNCYIEYQETKHFSGVIIHIFDELIKRKILKMPTAETPKIQEYYDGILEKSKKEIQRELNSEVCLTKKDKNEVIIELNKIIENNSSKVQIRAKKLVLIDFFNKQISLNKKLII
jgi:hypothetical protein